MTRTESSPATYDADVAIIGYGPSGVVAASYLGMAGVSTVVLEKDKDLYVRARAVTVNDWTLPDLPGLRHRRAGQGRHGPVSLHHLEDLREQAGVPHPSQAGRARPALGDDDLSAGAGSRDPTQRGEVRLARRALRPPLHRAHPDRRRRHGQRHGRGRRRVHAAGALRAGRRWWQQPGTSERRARDGRRDPPAALARHRRQGPELVAGVQRAGLLGRPGTSGGRHPVGEGQPPVGDPPERG